MSTKLSIDQRINLITRNLINDGDNTLMTAKGVSLEDMRRIIAGDSDGKMIDRKEEGKYVGGDVKIIDEKECMDEDIKSSDGRYIIKTIIEDKNIDKIDAKSSGGKDVELINEKGDNKDEIEINNISTDYRPLKIYWGTATTGSPSFAYFVPMCKIRDFLLAGCDVTILLADLHSHLDALKTPEHLLEHRTNYYEEVIRSMLLAINAPVVDENGISKLRFVRGSSFQLTPRYSMDMLKLCARVSQSKARKAVTDVIKSSTSKNNISSEPSRSNKPDKESRSNETSKTNNKSDKESRSNETSKTNNKSDKPSRSNETSKSNETIKTNNSSKSGTKGSKRNVEISSSKDNFTGAAKILERSSESKSLSGNVGDLIYPLMQCLDEEYLDVDVQFGGLDQRKIFVLANEILPIVGYRKRIHLMNPMMPSLVGGRGNKMSVGSSSSVGGDIKGDVDSKTNKSDTGMEKMSSSSTNKNAKIELFDSSQVVMDKIKRSFAAPRVVDNNVLLCICRFVLFPLLDQLQSGFNGGKDLVVGDKSDVKDLAINSRDIVVGDKKDIRDIKEIKETINAMEIKDITNVIDSKDSKLEYKFIIERDEKYGGNVTFFNYEDLEAAYASGSLFPQDLKMAIGKYINILLSKFKMFATKLDVLYAKAYPS